MAKKNKCLKCGYEWIGKVDKVKQCPYCKSYRWNQLAKEAK